MALELIIVAVVIFLGILFILAEIFLLPGISVAGIAGVIFIIGGIAYAYLYLGSTAGNITLVVSAVVMGLSFFWLIKSKPLRRISLETNIEGKVDNSNLLKMAVGDSGITLSRLNPVGKVLVNDTEAEGRSYDGEFIEEESEIEIVRVESYHVLVKRKETAINS